MDYKKAYLLSLLYLVGLLIASLIFYQERMLFVDPAFISFEIVNSKSFIISEHRYGAFITQVFPLICTFIKAPLTIILLVYSASFYIFFLVVAWISGHVLDERPLCILFTLYLCLFVTDVYFWPNNEVHQSVGWMILFLSVYRYALKREWRIKTFVHPILITSLFLSIISHLLVLIPLSFLWCYLWLDRERIKAHLKYFLFYSSLIVLFTGIRYYLSMDSWYDGVKLQGVQQMNLRNIGRAIVNDQSTSIIHLMFTKYWMCILIFLTGIGSLVYKRKFTLVILTLLFTVLYYLLVVLTHSVGITSSNLFYFESQWVCLALIISTPFVFETIQLIKNHRIVLLAFVLIFLFKIPQLYNSLDKFQNRLTQLEHMVEVAQEKDLEKAYIYNSVELEGTFLMTWGIPIETTLLSCIKDEEELVSVKVLNKNQNISIATDSVYTAFKFLAIEDLNIDYFNFSKNTRYKPLYPDKEN